MPFCIISREAFSAVGWQNASRQSCRSDWSPEISCVGILRPCALETSVNDVHLLKIARVFMCRLILKTYNFSYTTCNLWKKLKRHIILFLRHTFFCKIKRHIIVLYDKYFSYMTYSCL